MCAQLRGWVMKFKHSDDGTNLREIEWAYGNKMILFEV